VRDPRLYQLEPLMALRILVLVVESLPSHVSIEIALAHEVSLAIFERPQDIGHVPSEQDAHDGSGHASWSETEVS
jgi:hypothetical protein